MAARKKAKSPPAPAPAPAKKVVAVEGFELHGGTKAYPGGQKQALELALAHDITTITVGRSWGKTVFAVFLPVVEAMSCPSRYQVAYCAPTYKLAKQMYRLVKQDLACIIEESRDSDLVLHLKPFGENNGVEWYFWSLENYDAHRGNRLHRWIVDECADIHPDAPVKVLEPCGLGRSGKGLYLGTPKWTGLGAVWFKRYFDRGMSKDPKWAAYASMTGPSHANPTLKHEELTALENRYVGQSTTYREEILAEWIENEGSVFKNLEAVFDLPFTERTPGQLWIGAEPDTGVEATTESEGRLPDAYAMALDFGLSDDWTVASVFNKRTRHQVALFRMRHREFYSDMIPFIHELRSRYNDATVIYDAAGGHGGAIAEWLAKTYGDGAIPRAWNATSKKEDIAHAQILCERASIPDTEHPGWHMLSVPWQYEEWRSYQVSVTTSAGMRKQPTYSAPPGMHDDSVSAGCLAAHLLRHKHPDHPVDKKIAPGFRMEHFFRGEEDGVQGGW